MHTKKDGLYRVLLLVFALVLGIAGFAGASNLFPTFADDHTVAMWLFDEGYYPHTTLTDAGKYEYDLRLQDGGRLVEGRFGNALKVLSRSAHAVSYAGTMGDIGGRQMREKDGIPSGLWGPAVTPEKLLSMFSRSTWTCEFWLKFGSVPRSRVVVLDIGYAYDAGVTISYSAGARSFEIMDAYAGFKAACATDSGALGDGKWHHIAFTRSASRPAVRHYVDGRKQAEVTLTPMKVQPVPRVGRDDSSGFSKDKSFDWRRQHRFNITAGHDRRGGNRINGMIDEIRLSDVVRYSKNFGIVGTHSRNYGAHASKPAVANGPPLLFAADAAKGVVKLGG
ncbi:MAG: LamG-like jellyroll fold domain-containing protein, partial [Planctomycetota bacterium]